MGVLAGVAAESRRFRLRRFPAQDSPQPWRISPPGFSGPHPVLRPSRHNLPRRFLAWGDLVFRPEPGPRVPRLFPAFRLQARLPRRQGRGKKRSLGSRGTFPAIPEFLVRFIGAVYWCQGGLKNFVKTYSENQHRLAAWAEENLPGGLTINSWYEPSSPLGTNSVLYISLSTAAWRVF